MSSKTFKDAKGRAFTVEITTGAYLKVKNELGIDLAAFGVSHKATRDEQEQAVERFYDFLYSADQFPPVLICCLGEQLKAQNLTVEEFHAGFDPRSVADATNAFKQALVDFFQHPLKKAAFETLLRGMTRLEAILTKRVAAAVEPSIQEAERRMNQMIDEAAKKPFSASPELSA